MAKDIAELSNRKAAAALLPFHPAAKMFPLMRGEEFEKLVADIKHNGLRFPITTFDDGKGGKSIVEGVSRYRACLTAKVEPRYTPFEGEEKDIVSFVVSANLHRRHLTPKQRRDVAAKLVKLYPEKSDRQIGEMAKLSKNTVASVRSNLEARGQIDHVEKREDSKGRKQPAKKKPKAKPSSQPSSYVPKPAPATKDGAEIAPRSETSLKAWLTHAAWRDAPPDRRRLFIDHIGLIEIYRAASEDQQAELMRLLRRENEHCMREAPAAIAGASSFSRPSNRSETHR